MEQEKKGCCPPGSWPYLASDYAPRGKHEKIDDVPVYTIGQGEKAVVIIPDAFGPDAGRHKSVADQIADAGYLVVLVDVFKGNRYTDPTFSKIREWMEDYTWEKLQGDIVGKVLPHLTANKGVKRIAMLGFCYGAYIVFHASTTGKIDLGLNFHPSVHAFEEAEPLAEKIKCPQLVCPAGNDPDNMKEGNSVEKILKSKEFGDKVKIRSFPDMRHGWMMRAELNGAEELRDFKAGMELALEYLKDNL